MLDEIFILILYLTIACVFRWAFQALPDEQWQVIGSVPLRKQPDGFWQGWNLTWYGFFNATSVVLAAALFLILTGSMSVPSGISLSILLVILAVCMPAARLIAYLVEKRHGTFTIGGAFFTGILLAPWIIWVSHIITFLLFQVALPVVQILTAMSIAYALGEGTGRLACISFGCCYGKPLADCPIFLQRLFSKSSFTFTGKTKKIAFEHHLDGVKVLPIQAITAVVYSLTGILGCYLFLKGFTFSVFFMILLVTQIWRILSETLRADYRGNGRISAYQIMAGAAIFYAIPVCYFLNDSGIKKTPALASGLSSLWNPALILLLPAVWLITLIYMGKSKVTSSVIQIIGRSPLR